MNNEYAERRNILVDGLADMGLVIEKPLATFYLWIEVPKEYTSAEFASHLLLKGGIVVTPGNGFGAAGEGYVRMALTVGKERLKEVIKRISSIGL